MFTPYSSTSSSACSFCNKGVFTAGKTPSTAYFCHIGNILLIGNRIFLSAIEPIEVSTFIVLLKSNFLELLLADV